MSQARRNSKTLPESEELRLERLRDKGKSEIGEVEELIPEKIKEMKELIATGEQRFHMHPDKFDDFYLKCLRARKFDVERAAKLYTKYCTAMSKNEQVQRAMIPSYFSSHFDKGLLSVFKARDKKGRHVSILRNEVWDPKEMTFDQVLAAMMVVLDEMTNSVDTQLNGVVLIGDMKNLSLSQFRIIRPIHISAVASVIQDAYPARFKEFHFVNNPYIFGMLWSLIKPMVKEKMRKRIMFHGSDMDSLHRSLSLDPKFLPDFLGGQVPEDQCMDQAFFDSLLQKDEFYKEFLKYGSPTDPDEVDEDR